MAKKTYTQNEIQHQQLVDVISSVRESFFGHYLGFNKLSSKQFKNLEYMHLALIECSEVLSYTQFIDLISGISGNNEKAELPELFLVPNLMTTEKIEGVCTLEESTSKSLPITGKQIDAMRHHRKATYSRLCKKLKIENPKACVHFYNNPVVNILTENRVWLTGIESLLTKPIKRGMFFKGGAASLPDITLFTREEKRLSNFIRIFKETLENNPQTEAIYAQPYHFSDVGHYLRTEYKRNMRLVDIAPNLKAVFLDVTALSSHEAGVQDFLQSHTAQIQTHTYRPEGMFGCSDVPEEPTVITPVLNAGAFYEFIPIKYFNPVKGSVMSNYQRLSVAKIEKDKKYVVVLSTIAGLIGFNTRTVVRIVDIDPLRFEVIGKIGALDHLGQMLTNEEADKMINKLNKTIVKPYQFYIRHYMVGEHRNQEKLVWAIELSRPPKSVSQQVLRGIANSIHSSLCKENQLYARTFEKPNLAPPFFVFLPPGTFMEGNNSGAKRVDFSEDSYTIKQLISLAGDRQVKIRAARVGMNQV